MVGGNEIKATQPNLVWAWPELGNIDISINIALMAMPYLKHLTPWALWPCMTEQYNTQFSQGG